MTTVLDLPAVHAPRNQQRVFRLLLDAMARPGTLADLAPWTDGAPAHAAVLAALCDGEVSIADPDGLLSDDDWRFLDCPASETASARFVLARGDAAPGSGFAPMRGTLTAPETGATLLLTASGLGSAGLRAQLAGPGIAGEREARLGNLHSGWLTCREEWVSFFPLGVDIVVCDGPRLLALPRTTRVALDGEKP